MERSVGPSQALFFSTCLGEWHGTSRSRVLYWTWRTRTWQTRLAWGHRRAVRNLFGTAIQFQVDELRDRYNRLTVVANANNRAIHIKCQKLAKLDRHVSELGSYANHMKLSLDRVLETLNSFYDFLVVDQALPALENAVNSLLHTNQQIITNVVDAAHGRVTPSLFQVKD